MPLLLYKALTRNAFWSIPLGVSLVAVLLLQSRSALIAVAISCCLFLIQRRKYLILIVGAAAIGIVSLLWIGPTIDALLSVGFQSGSGFSANALLTDRISLIWVPLVDEWTSNIGLFLFGAGRFGMITSQLWYTGALYHATHAHNAFIDFFLDNGAILSVVLMIFLYAGIVTAWRAGRRLDSDLYWALFAGIFGFGIGMMTEREIFPTIDNMYVFPIIAMMINLARLRCLFQPEDDVWPLVADRDAAAEAVQGEHQLKTPMAELSSDNDAQGRNFSCSDWQAASLSGRSPSPVSLRRPGSSRTNRSLRQEGWRKEQKKVRRFTERRALR